MSQASSKHVLFVCTGNTCRSPMAERLLTQYLAQEGLDCIKVSSAGVSAFTGDSMSYETQQLLVEQDCDINRFASRRVVTQLLDECDIVLAMTRSHLSALRTTFPESQEKYYLLDSDWQNLKDTGVDTGRDIADPIGCGMPAYESVAKDFKRIFPNLIHWLKDLN